jgi:cytochrome b
MTRQSILVWDLPTRIFHWLLAGCFVGAFSTGDSERWRDIHIMLGYTMLILIAFRVVWGVIGTRYARFSSFAYGPGRVAAYLRSLLSAKPEHHVGHNPAGSWAIYLLLGLALTAGITGYAAHNELGGEWLEEFHEGAANVLLAVVLVHIAGVIASSLRHGENLVASMITGRKTGKIAEGIRKPQRIVAAVLLAGVIGFWVAGKPYVLPTDTAASGFVKHADADHENARRSR